MKIYLFYAFLPFRSQLIVPKGTHITSNLPLTSCLLCRLHTDMNNEKKYENLNSSFHLFFCGLFVYIFDRSLTKQTNANTNKREGNWPSKIYDLEEKLIKKSFWHVPL
jgi:hypothetical protein